jgi:hypothetical protein
MTRRALLANQSEYPLEYFAEFGVQAGKPTAVSNIFFACSFLQLFCDKSVVLHIRHFCSLYVVSLPQ